MEDWTKVSTISQAFDLVRNESTKYEAEELPFRLGGYSQTDLTQHAAKLKTAIPDDVVEMYRLIRGVTDPFGPCLRCVTLLDLPATHWIDPREDPILREIEDEFPGWFDAKYFAIGQTEFGDTLAYCSNPPIGHHGAVLMLDHERQGPEGSKTQPSIIVVYADSLAQWLARWATLGFEEFGYILEIKGLQSPLRERFAQDHERLNPGVDVDVSF